MKQQNKLSQEQQQQVAAEQQTQQQPVRVYANAEEMLREDARNTPVPPGIAVRLQKSVDGLSQPRRSWWQRLFER